MIPNKSLDRLFDKEAQHYEVSSQSKGLRTVTPYEEVEVTMWNFNCPSGPSEFMIEEAKGDFVKRGKDRFMIRCRQGGHVIEVEIYTAHLYFCSSYRTMARIQIPADQSTFKPSKDKI